MSRLDARLELTRDAFRLDAALDIPAAGITALFGPSGAGKTTLLRCLCGLDRARGHLRVGGETWQDDAAGTFVPPHRRAVGYVPQDQGLFRHLDVRGNLEYGYRRVPEAERQLQIDAVVEPLGVADLLGRSTTDLSGGERQRVALGRALLASPRLLLLDEPLSALDEAARDAILPVFERLPAEFGVPVVLVSHSLREVARLADRIVWLAGGRVREVGDAGELLASISFGREQGDAAGAVVGARVARHDTEFALTELDSPCGTVYVRRLPHPEGSEVHVQILARDVSLAVGREVRSSILNQFDCTIEEVSQTGPGQCLVRLGCGGTRLLARVTEKSVAALGLVPGLSVVARVKSVGLLG